MSKDEILKKYEEDREYHFHQVDREWIMEAMQEYADQQLRLYDVSRSKRFCKTDVLNAYVDGGVEMYNKLLHSLKKETLKNLRKDSEKWFKIYDK